MLTTANIVQACSGPVSPVTMSAVVLTESGGWPWAIWDNTANRRYTLPNQAAAVAVATRLIAAGHKLDMGLAQVDSWWLRRLRLSVKQVFNPCQNVSVGASILATDYKASLAHGYKGGQAMTAALEDYNSGQLSGDRVYARIVYHQARAPFVNVPNIQSGSDLPAVPAMSLKQVAKVLPPSPYTASMVIAVPKPPIYPAPKAVPVSSTTHRSILIRFP